MLGLSYGGEESLTLAREIMSLICHTAYRTSVVLGEEKGSFPYLDRDKYLEGPFIRRLPEEIRRDILALERQTEGLLKKIVGDGA